MGQIRCAHERQAYLATVRVPGELQIDGVLSDIVGPVGLMSQQDHRFDLRYPIQCPLQVRLSFQNVIHSRKPKPFPFAGDGNGTVSQDWDSVGLENFDDMRRIRAQVMVAQSPQNA